MTRDAPGERPPAARSPVLQAAAPRGMTLRVFEAACLPVDLGANGGDPLPLPGDSVDGDYYRLDPQADIRKLTLTLPDKATRQADAPDTGAPGDDQPAGHVAEGSPTGRAGAPVWLRGRISLMAPDGDRAEVLVLETPAGNSGLGSDGGSNGGANGGLARLALPLSPLRPGQVYTQIGADTAPGPIRLADMAAGAFATGTLIAMADGSQHPVERLAPSMSVITRDHGPQPLRWVGSVTLRAQGAFAPVTLLPGAMGNPRPLVVSPYHRLFLYRRDARALAGAAELLVQARHLTDGRLILRREGGFVTYHSLVFDRHEVIYAQGVPCESLQLCPHTLTRLPADLADALQERFPGLDQNRHAGLDVPPEIASVLVDREP